jgi:hypothetical protein
VRDGITCLRLGQTEHLGDDSGGGDLDEHNVVETDLVVRVLESEYTLDFVGLDHSLEHILDLEDLAVAELATGAVGSRDPVSDSEDGTKIVRWVTPLSGKPAVVKVEPSDHSTNVEGATDWVELEWGTWDLDTVLLRGAFNDWTELLDAIVELEGLKTTAEGVNEDPAGSVELVSD